jgi:hypothetical protein
MLSITESATRPRGVGPPPTFSVYGKVHLVGSFCGADIGDEWVLRLEAFNRELTGALQCYAREPQWQKSEVMSRDQMPTLSVQSRHWTSPDALDSEVPSVDQNPWAVSVFGPQVALGFAMSMDSPSPM